MIGFKTISEFTVEECFEALKSQDASSPHYVEIKDRFVNLAHALTLEESYAFLERHKGCEENELYRIVHGCYCELVEECRREEEHDLTLCKTIEDFNRFISKYGLLAPAYVAKYAEEARDRIVELQEELDYKACRTIAHYNGFVAKYTAMKNSKRVDEAVQAIRRIKRVRWSALAGTATIIALVFLLGYKPVKQLEFDDVVFGKDGGKKTALIVSNVKTRNIEVTLPQEDWLQCKQIGRKISFEARLNMEGEHKCNMEIVAYPTLFGERIESKKETKSVVITQESGCASALLFEKRLLFSQYGEAKRINIKTDGVNLDVSCEARWVHITPVEQRRNGQFYHDDDYEIKVDKNPNERQAAEILIKSGNKVDKMEIIQESGYANTIIVDPTTLKFDKLGGTKQITVKTDGVSLSLSTTEGSWIEIRRLKQERNEKHYHVDSYEIKTTRNSNAERKGKVIVSTNGLSSKEITITQASGVESKFVVINGTELRLRYGPSTSYDTFKWKDGSNRHPKKGTKYRYLGEKDDFYKIDFHGHELWVSKQYSYIE